MSVVVSTLRIAAMDIANGSGVATVTLRSGVQFKGRVEKRLSMHEVLHLVTEKGWHTIDYVEIAAITGERA